MTTDWKYVIFDRDGLETAMIFPPWVKHSEVGMRLSGKPISAGFVTLDAGAGELVAHGESESLKLKSRPEIDRVLLTKLLSNPYT